MSLALTTLEVLAVLALAGGAPALALVGPGWRTLPLAVAAGAVLAGQAATLLLVLGGSLLTWFVVLAVVAAALVGLWWWRVPVRRPVLRVTDDPVGMGRSLRWAGVLGALVVAAVVAWGLLGLDAPTVGFDARAIWILRAGWFLEPHHQLVFNMQTPVITLYQSGYPPLISALDALAWRLSGGTSMRLAVVVTAAVAACLLFVAAFAAVEIGRSVARRRAGERPLVPMVAGVVVAGALALVALGTVGPFLTNGYADPMWALAATGVVGYGLQADWTPANRGAAWFLVVVAGTTKDEGFLTALVLVVLLVARGVRLARRAGSAWWRPVVPGVAVLVLLGSWPLALRLESARGRSIAVATTDLWGRLDASAHGLAPYLHSLLWAAVVTALGLILVRTAWREAGVAAPGWAWAGVGAGLLVLAFVYGTGTAVIGPWLVSTVHRVSEFVALAGWWIVGVTAVVALGATGERAVGRSPDDGDRR